MRNEKRTWDYEKRTWEALLELVPPSVAQRPSRDVLAWANRAGLITDGEWCQIDRYLYLRTVGGL